MTKEQIARLNELREMEFDGLLDHSVGSKDTELWNELETLEEMEDNYYRKKLGYT